MVKRGLGRGLGSLIPGLTSDNLNLEEISVTEIDPNQNQPRQQFDPEALADLVASVAKHGVVQPVIVRAKDNRYELIAGERRWRAAKEAGLASVPALIKKSDDSESLQLALVENVQRQDLNGLEEAQAYKRLVDEFSLSQAELAELVGKNRATVANTLRLLNLPESVRELVFEDKLSSGHARTLLGLVDEEQQIKLAKRVISEGLSVRQTEELVKVWGLSQSRPKTPKKLLSPEIRTITRRLGRSLGTRVRAKLVNDKLKVEIELHNHEELQRLEEIIVSGTRETKPTRP